MKPATGTAALLWAVLLAVSADPCAAAGSSAAWRGTYDTVMMWINFVILLALLIKLLRRPLQDFLGTQRDTLVREMDRLTKQKEQAEADIAGLRTETIARNARFEIVFQNIIDSGEKERRALIESARRQADAMMAGSRQRIDHQLRKAGAAFRAELIDAAMDMALAQLPIQTTAQDDRQWVDRFILDIDTATL